MVLNIIGMSVSLMVFLALFAQVWHDYRFNSNFEDYKNIYRFESKIPIPITIHVWVRMPYTMQTNVIKRKSRREQVSNPIK